VTSQRSDWNALQRGGWIVLWLWQGSRLSDSDIARLCGISRQHAWRTMQTLEATFPIVKEGGKWGWLSIDDK
jgi:hypothetical protein